LVGAEAGESGSILGPPIFLSPFAANSASPSQRAPSPNKIPASVTQQVGNGPVRTARATRSDNHDNRAAHQHPFDRRVSGAPPCPGGTTPPHRSAPPPRRGDRGGARPRRTRTSHPGADVGSQAQGPPPRQAPPPEAASPPRPPPRRHPRVQRRHPGQCRYPD